ncbi:hypothetical protein H5410_017238 [Solanum commersonii]|uniref:Uncharacterized protein n=1 Tax=Solanum commersonii TaxID=4109 RepID=A0A9J5ZYI9_SOLCO|nr:hypothetical protein H5410_017238 [Solanum commersonii]
MVELYLDDFDQFSMGNLQNQLANYIIDVRDTNKRFSNLGGLREFSRKMVETKKKLTYPLIFSLSEIYFASSSCYCNRCKRFLGNEVY